MVEVDAIILASGLSKRMGSNKLLLPFEQTTLLGHFLENFPHRYFHSVQIICTKDSATVAADYPWLSIIDNERPEIGQAEAITLGVDNSTARHGLMFFVADQPLLQAATIELLLKNFTKDPSCIIRPRSNGVPANPVIFPADLKEELAQLKGDTGGRQILKSHPERLKFVDFSDADQFADIDTPQDYQALLDKTDKS